MRSRYLFKGFGSAIAAFTVRLRVPRGERPVPPDRALPLRRSLKGRKRKLGEAGAVPGILPRGLGSQRFLEGMLTTSVRSPVEVPKYDYLV